MIKRFFKNEKGLTLIELLAVIVILGIIAAIAVPSISNIIDNTRAKAKVAEAIQIINAAKIAHAEHPDQNTWTYEGTKDGSNNKTSDALKSYLDKISDTSFTVTYSNNKYSIKGHNAWEGLNHINGNTNLNNTSDIPEQDLINATK